MNQGASAVFVADDAGLFVVTPPLLEDYVEVITKPGSRAKVPGGGSRGQNPMVGVNGAPPLEGVQGAQPFGPRRG